MRLSLDMDGLRALLMGLIVGMLPGCAWQRPPEPETAGPDCESRPGVASRAPGLEGLYCTGCEVAGFSGTTLELKAGKFRYWFYSDVGGLDRPSYPVVGDYSFEDGKLSLRHGDVNQEEWFADVVNGVPVLWRLDGLQMWRERRRIYDYAVLIKTEGSADDRENLLRPSIRALYDDEAQQRNKEWKDPFVHGPQ